MHFICGQSFTCNGLRRPTSAEGFSKGISYTLYYIRNNHIKAIDQRKKLTYTFLDERGSKIEIDFADARQADEFIAGLAGVQIPNYTSVYERRST